MHFLKRASARDRSLIGKSPSDYEAWKPSRRVRGIPTLRARGDSFQSVDEGAGSGSNSSLLRKIRSPDNCDLSSRKGNPERGGKNERTRERERDKAREGRKRDGEGLRESKETTCFDTFIFSEVHLRPTALIIRSIN